MSSGPEVASRIPSGSAKNDQKNPVAELGGKQQAADASSRAQTKEKSPNQPEDDQEVNENLNLNYVQFFKKRYSALKKQFPKRNQNELTKLISIEWQILKLKKKKATNEEEKQPPSLNLPERGHSVETAAETRRGRQKTPATKVSDPAAPQVPKRPLIAYMKFCQMKRGEVIQGNPKIANTEVAKQLGEMWTQLDSRTKEEYQRQYRIEMEAYEAAMQKFRSEHGYDPRRASKKKKQHQILGERSAAGVQSKKQQIGGSRRTDKKIEIEVSSESDSAEFPRKRKAEKGQRKAEEEARFSEPRGKKQLKLNNAKEKKLLTVRQDAVGLSKKPRPDVPRQKTQAKVKNNPVFDLLNQDITYPLNYL